MPDDTHVHSSLHFAEKIASDNAMKKRGRKLSIIIIIRKRRKKEDKERQSTLTVIATIH